MSDRLPSTDLYFGHACGALVGRWWRSGPIVALGANCFVSGDTMLLIRRDDEKVMERALEWKGRLLYLIDDDIGAAKDSAFLAEDYRRRLMRFEIEYHDRLLRRADIILVPSQPLAALFFQDRQISGAIHRIEPYWPFALADQRHFGELTTGGPVRIAHLGSGSHSGGLTALAPIIAELLRQRDDFTFTYIAKEAPGALKASHPRLRRISPMPWSRYRRWLPRQRFHLGIYPLDAGRFDRARSSNKLMEHAIVGAVGLYPEDWDCARRLVGGALFAPSDAATWGSSVIRALTLRESLAGLAARAAAILSHEDRLAEQRYLWREILAIEAA